MGKGRRISLSGDSNGKRQKQHNQMSAFEKRLLESLEHQLDAEGVAEKQMRKYIEAKSITLDSCIASAELEAETGAALHMLPFKVLIGTYCGSFKKEALVNVFGDQIDSMEMAKLHCFLNELRDKAQEFCRIADNMGSPISPLSDSS